MPPSLTGTSRRVARLLLAHPEGLTQGEIAERADASRVTVSKAIAQLEAERMVNVAGRRSSSGGRPAFAYTLAPLPGTLLGVDFGHAHVTVARADGAGKLVGTPSTVECSIVTQGLDAFDVAVKALQAVLGPVPNGPVLAVGVGVPGTVSRDGKVLGGYLRLLEGQDVAREFGRRLARAWNMDHFDAVVLENDANLGALGIASSELLGGATNYVYAKTSSGIGAGVMVDGAMLHRGAHGAAGEWGHVTTSSLAEDAIGQATRVPAPVERCPRCRRLACLENLASCSAILAQVNAILDSADHVADFPGLVRMITEPGVEASILEVVQNAATRIAYTLADLARIVDPEVVILGGLFALSRDVTRPIVTRIMQEEALPPAVPRVEFASDSVVYESEVRGALVAALREARRRSPWGTA